MTMMLLLSLLMFYEHLSTKQVVGLYFVVIVTNSQNIRHNICPTVNWFRLQNRTQ